MAFALNPQALTYLPLVLLAGAVILFFFTWIGAYPGGYPVYWQRGWQVVGGWFGTDLAGNAEFELQKSLEENRGFGPTTLAYFLVLLAAVILSASTLVVPRLPMILPALLQRILEWRPLLAAGTTLVALLFLILQMVMGFPLERAFAAIVDKDLKERREQAKTPEQVQRVEIKRGSELARFSVGYTGWLYLNLICLVGAMVAALLDFWLIRRGKRALPKMELLW
jgi:hypothetical protein